MPLTSAQIFAFDALVFLAILLVLLALVPPIFSRHVIRRKTWHNLMLSSLVFSVGIILRIGHQSGRTLPSPALCLLQTTLDLAAAPLYAAAMVSYTIDIYFSIRHMFKSDDWDGPEPENVVFLVLAPWIIFLLVFLEAILVVGLAKGQDTTFNNKWELYCRTQNVATYAVSAGIVVLGGFILVGCQAATGWLLYKNWIRVKNISITSTARKYIYAFVRTLIFTVIAMLGIILGMIATFTVEPMFGFSILLPFLPILTALIFGTYKDILSFYSFWR